MKILLIIKSFKSFIGSHWFKLFSVCFVIIGGFLFYFYVLPKRGDNFEILQQKILELENQLNNTSSTKNVIANVNTQPKVETHYIYQNVPVKDDTVKEVIAKVSPAIVYIQTEHESGSGMIIESDGYILTNAHVVSDVTSATIKFSDGRSLISAVVGRDENLDLALLKITGLNYPTVELGDSDFMEQGDDVYVFGYPFGIEGDVSFKEGTISRKHTMGDMTYLETSAEVHPGNSGGLAGTPFFRQFVHSFCPRVTL